MDGPGEQRGYGQCVPVDQETTDENTWEVGASGLCPLLHQAFNPLSNSL